MKRIINNKKYLFLVSFFVIASIILGTTIYKYMIKDKYIIALNITTSLPDYFYIIDTTNKLQAKKNNVIAFYFKKKNDRYYNYNHNFIKKIVCQEGDILTEDKYHQFKCNNHILGTAMSTDSKGRKVQAFQFNGKIPTNKYFVMGSAYNSYDSRYWGFVDKKDIIGVALW